MYGDGSQSRDFTFVDDVVDANLAAARAPAPASGRVFNIACGKAHTLLELLEVLGRLMDITPAPVFLDRRPGDICTAWPMSDAARDVLGFQANVEFADGLGRTVAWSGPPPGPS